jgi:electron transfer flavoprotein beta subunit
MGLRAVVLLRGILDPELPAERFRVDPATNRPRAGIAPLVNGPFERSALEVAMKLRDSGAVEHVTILAAGGRGTLEILRKALSAKADAGVLVDVEGLDSLDPGPTAELLARAIERLAPVDLVLTGRQAGDWDNGQVGYLLAERLGWACVGLARKVWADGAALHAIRDHPRGLEQVGFRTPAVMTVTSDDSNVLRLAKVPDVLAAARKPITTWTPADLELSDGMAEFSQLEVLALRPIERKTEVHLISGDSPAEVVTKLAGRLLDLRPG